MAVGGNCEGGNIGEPPTLCASGVAAAGPAEGAAMPAFDPPWMQITEAQVGEDGHEAADRGDPRGPVVVDGSS